MNKAELVATIAAVTGQSQTIVERVINAFFESIAEAVSRGSRSSSRAG